MAELEAEARWIAVDRPQAARNWIEKMLDASAREREPQARATAPARSSGIRMRVFIVKARIERHRKGAGGRPLTHPSGAEVINS